MRPGDRLGRYELLRPLGRGGMGEVWEAVLHGPAGFRRRVALKLVHAAADQELVREARLGGLLSHPHIAATLELGEADGRWFVAMELVEGQTLHDLTRDRPLPPRALIEVGLQTCSALAHIHGLRVDDEPAGLVHRDIKPQNLLLDAHGMVKVVDLGIARLTGEPGGAAGTPGYMAPEQRAGREEARSDLFSLGATMYRLGTGVNPFGPTRDRIRLTEAVEELLADPSFRAAVDRGVPGLGDVLVRCLRYDPADRWPSAVALGAALRSLLTRDLAGAGTRQLMGGAAAPPGETVRTARSSGSDAETVLVAGNLPTRSDGFVGRQAECDAVAQGVRAGVRCLTVLGAGGMGKTRLAIEAVAHVAPELGGGGWFFDLSEASSVEGICHAVGGALGVPLPGADPVRTIGLSLAARGRSVVILDNFEQVAEHAPQTVARWVELAPQTRFVVTSQIRLGLRDEETLLLGPLSTVEGAELFVARAQGVGVERHRRDIAQLVAALDGMPLAIELAAARTRLITVPQIVARLDDLFRLAAGGDASRPARHRSLRASLQASWELLNGWEQAAMAQLSVFVAPFGLGPVEAVLDLRDHPEAPWTLDVLTALVDCSLLQFDPGQQRFRMLVPIHRYADEQLAGLAREQAEQRHAAWFAQPGAPENREIDLQDRVAAARRALARGDVAIAARCALGTQEVFVRRGPPATAARLARDILAHDPPAPAALHHMLGVALRLEGNLAGAIEALTLGVEAARSESLVELARNLSALSLTQLHLGRSSEPMALAEEATRIAEQAGDDWVTGRAFAALGNALRRASRYDEGRVAHERSIEAATRAGDVRSQASGWVNLAVLQITTDPEQALDKVMRALDIHREQRDLRAEGDTLGILGSMYRRVGDLGASRRALEEALVRHRQVGNLFAQAVAYSNLGNVTTELGELDEAVRLLERAVEVHRQLGSTSSECLALANLVPASLLLGRVDAARAVGERAEQLAALDGAPRLVALTRGALGMVAAAEGQPDEARARFADAAEQLATSGLAGEGAAFLLELSLLELAQGELDRATELLDHAEPVLRERAPPSEVARAAIVRARLLHRRQAPEAEEARARAEQLAAALPAYPDGPVARLLADLHAEVDERPAT